MISVEPIEKILKCVLASGKVGGERPLSLIIIAPVECGKTSKKGLGVKSLFFTFKNYCYEGGRKT